MKLARPAKRAARLALSAAAAAALTVGLGTAAQAAPTLNTDPIPDNFDFSDCPTLPAGSDPNFSRCVSVVVTSGTFHVGAFDQAIDKPIQMTFANAYNPETFKYTAVFGKMRAEKMLVQPGLFGDPLLTAVYAQPEFAGVFDQPTSADFHIKMGLKIRLVNPFLGSNCRVGSDSNPITLELTTGTTSPPAPNTPITGEAAKIVRTDPQPTVRSAKHVDNSFAVPGAKGCVFGGGVADWLVNQVGGFPSAGGKNTVIFNEYMVLKPYSQL
ncbi:hypothetical protein E1293_27015 [Actinomadura darangshiensis]|uniref:Secreted protein n=1 Tax=Actinomadura darangshiensis TaxID=705336 RepID=A0A4R5AU62_9ACTN|nr:hypothetical protein [Actinomadura darangshiensis]TDD76561.1 hypothetical protein E1293_27015 [Actinomadura darangshiensis]